MRFLQKINIHNSYQSIVVALMILLYTCISCVNALADEARVKSFKPSMLDDQVISLASGRVTGVYYPLGKNICRLINHERKGVGLRCNTLQTAASPHNIVLMANGGADFAIIQSSWEKYGYDGTTGAQAIKANDKLRFIMSLHDEYIMFVVRKNSGINSINSMKGKVISSGSTTSNSKYNIALESVLAAKGWTLSDFQSVASIPFEEQAAALCNGSIDILNGIGGAPNEMIMEAAKMCEVSIVPIDSVTANLMINRRKELYTTMLPGGIYPGINQDVPVMAVKAVLVTNATVSDQIVYQFTKTVIENISNLKKVIPSLGGIDVKTMATDAAFIPMHNGALQYFTESGLISGEVQPAAAPATTPAKPKPSSIITSAAPPPPPPPGAVKK